MSYSISLSGHGPSADEVKAAFTALVQALRPSDNGAPTGYAGGSGGDGTSFSLRAEDVDDAGGRHQGDDPTPSHDDLVATAAKGVVDAAAAIDVNDAAASLESAFEGADPDGTFSAAVDAWHDAQNTAV